MIKGSMLERLLPSMARAARRWLAALGVLLLTSCYLPDKFIAEIQLGDNGDFGLTYRGELVWAPLFRDIQQHTIKPAAAATEIAALQRDLVRDHNFSKADSMGEGRFSVDYHREGHLQATDLVTFVRRNEIILELTASPDGKVVIVGNTIQPGQAVQAMNMGLNISGEFRVITSGEVLDQNATAVRTVGPYTLYIWTIENAFSPAPHLVMRRAGNWTPPPQNFRRTPMSTAVSRHRFSSPARPRASGPPRRDASPPAVLA